tara:strand:- start:6918 stop:7691 length:774 start_codon:yes stop_codon:yes gene_type:complete
MDNKDLIKQYVTIGVRIPKSQMVQLSNNDLKSYLRARIIANQGNEGNYYAELLDYEYEKMDDNQKNTLIKTLDKDKIDDSVMTLNWRAYSDDFVSRLIRLRPIQDITDNIVSILNHSRSTISVLYDILKIHGPQIYNSSRNIGFVLNKFDSQQPKLRFCITYLKLLSNDISGVMSVNNSSINSMVYGLDDMTSKTIIKYFITLNLKKSTEIDDDTFFTLLNHTSDSTFDEVSIFMQRHLSLKPNQLDFIEKEKNNEQ